jgi:hypothetical protein
MRPTSSFRLGVWHGRVIQWRDQGLILPQHEFCKHFACSYLRSCFSRSAAARGLYYACNVHAKLST